MKTTAKKRLEVHHRLALMGIGFHEANQLRRIALTLHRWFELECGDGNDFASWAIERDETTNKPYLCRYPHQGKPSRTPVADRERGANKRLGKIMAGLPDLLAYIQGDCRGASLYILRKSDVREGEKLDGIYTRGVAVY